MSFSRELKVAQLLIDYIKDLTSDIPSKDFNKQIITNSTTPAWTIGHLTLEATKSSLWLGSEIAFPREWKKYFKQGKKPSDIPDEINKKELLQHFFQVYEEFFRICENASKEEMNQANPSALLGTYLPKVKHDITHMLTSHLGIHAGHIGMWRKIYGLENKYGG